MNRGAAASVVPASVMLACSALACSVLACNLVACGGATVTTRDERGPRAGDDTGGTGDLRDALFPPRRAEAVRVERWGAHTALMADGRVYATNGEDVPTLVAAAMLPLAAHAGELAETRCATIGAGSGVEASALAGFGCSAVDVYEAERDLLRAAGELGPLVDDRLRARAAPFSVRAEVPADGTRYDVLVETYATRWLVGSERLLTAERLAHVAAVLEDDGIFATVLPLYSVHDRVIRRWLRTLAETFDELVLVAPGELASEVIVLASRSSIALDLARVERWMGAPATRRWSERAATRTAWDLIARVFLRDRAEVLEVAADAAVVTGDAPLSPLDVPLGPASPPSAEQTEGFAEAWQEEHDRFVAQFEHELLEGFASSEWAFGHACPDLPRACAAIRRAPTEVRLEVLVLALLVHERFDWIADAIERAREDEANVEAAARLVSVFFGPPSQHPDFDPLAPFPSGIGEAEALRDAWTDRDSGAASIAVELLEAAIEDGHDDPRLLLARVMAMVLAADGRDVATAASALAQDHAAYCDANRAAWFWIGRAFSRSERPVEAAHAMARHLELGPYDSTPR